MDVNHLILFIWGFLIVREIVQDSTVIDVITCPFSTKYFVSWPV